MPTPPRVADRAGRPSPPVGGRRPGARRLRADLERPASAPRGRTAERGIRR